MPSTAYPPGAGPFDFSDFGSPPSAGEPVSDAAAHVPTGGFDPFAGEAPATHPPVESDQVFAGSNRPAVPALAVTGPPLRLFAVVLAVSMAGVVLSVVAATEGAVLDAFAGWLLAGPTAIGALAAFSSIDTRRRLSAVYSAPIWLRSAYWVVVVTCAVGIGVGAWQIALWAGRS